MKLLHMFRKDAEAGFALLEAVPDDSRLPSLLQTLNLEPKTQEAVANIASHFLFGDFKKTAEAVNVLLKQKS